MRLQSASNLNLPANQAVVCQLRRGNKKYQSRVALSEEGGVSWDDMLTIPITLYKPNNHAKNFDAKNFYIVVRTVRQRGASVLFLNLKTGEHLAVSFLARASFVCDLLRTSASIAPACLPVLSA